MTWAKLILIAMQLVQSWVRWAEENRLMDEGEKRGLLKAILATAAMLKMTDELRAIVVKMNEDEQRALSEGFYRD